ncbi:MAG TPA: Holliday junction resolvase RuvX [Gemmatimonadales bacterium]|nr:Holliday junction resolvase RuvX [Gemmatimonadales bacterium]
MRPEAGAGRVLGLDWGSKRFGVALSDPTRLIAQPLTTLKRRAGHRPPVREILDLITRHEVSLVVVGLPLSPDGEEGEAAGEARALGLAIARRSGVSVTWWDERLSTAAALRSARGAGVRDRDSRERIDQMAAAVILQHFLDAQTHRRADAQETP